MTLIAEPTRFTKSNTKATTISCRLCNGDADWLMQQRVLAKHDVDYFRCGHCDLIQTQRPYWLDEAYASAICAADTGAINRNTLTARLTSVVAWVLGISSVSPCLDFGGGHGVFCRMMRDRGFDFRWFDTHAANLFARGFESQPRNTHDLVTAFEVLEHLVDVRGELDRIFAARPKFVLISTMRHRGHEPGWWYYSPGTGQHVAFYSDRTMKHIASTFGYSVTGGRAYTLFVRNDVQLPSWRRCLADRLVSRSKGNATRRLVAVLERFGPRFTSRTVADCEAAHNR